MTTTQRIVTVWLDDSDCDECGWVVDTDIPEGGESNTIRVFRPTVAGKAKAVALAKKIGKARGLEVRLPE